MERRAGRGSQTASSVGNRRREMENPQCEDRCVYCALSYCGASDLVKELDERAGRELTGLLRDVERAAQPPLHDDGYQDEGDEQRKCVGKNDRARIERREAAKARFVPFHRNREHRASG